MKNIVLSVLALPIVSFAGSLDPTAGPAPTMVTLDQIYSRLNAMPILATNDTGATASDVLAGKEFWGLTSGEWGTRTGTMPARTLTAATNTVEAGYYGATSLTTIDPDLTASNIALDVNIFGVVGAMSSASLPVGTILPWHKNASGNSQVLPSDWVECDGSPYPGGGILTGNSPNLNAADGYSSGKFLRGSGTSGVFQESTRFRYGASGNEAHAAPVGGSFAYDDDGYQSTTGSVGAFGNIRANGVATREFYSRPVNMSVVWIIKYK